MDKKNKFKMVAQNNLQNKQQSNESIYSNTKRLHTIDINDIVQNPYQPRIDIKDINELKNSIQQLGLLQPLCVTKKDNQFVLIAGHRRLQALKELGYTTVDVIIDNLNDDKSLRLKALAENLQRENLDSIELAFAYQNIINEYNISMQDVADMINKTKAHVSQTMGILKLSEETIKAIKDNNYKDLLLINKLNKLDKSIQLYTFLFIKDMTKADANKYIDDLLKDNKSEYVSYKMINKKGNYSMTLNINIISDDERKKAVSELFALIKLLKKENE